MEERILEVLPHAIPLVFGFVIVSLIVMFVVRVLTALGNYNRSCKERRW